MKNWIAMLVMVMLTSGWAIAQGNGGSGGSGSGSGSGSGWNGHGGSGSGSNASPNQNWPPQVQAWLDGGAQGPIPQYLVARVRLEARPWLLQVMGIPQGQIAQKWANGEIAMLYLPTAPPTPVLRFRVSYGGGLILVEIEDHI